MCSVPELQAAFTTEERLLALERIRDAGMLPAFVMMDTAMMMSAIRNALSKGDPWAGNMTA